MDDNFHMKKVKDNILVVLGAIYSIFFVYSVCQNANTSPITLTFIFMYALIYFADELILKNKLSSWGTGKSFDNMGKENGIGSSQPHFSI